jgi:hypothetical protein
MSTVTNDLAPRDDNEQLVFALSHLHPQQMTMNNNNNDGPSPHPQHIPTYPMTMR